MTWASIVTSPFQGRRFPPTPQSRNQRAPNTRVARRTGRQYKESLQHKQSSLTWSRVQPNRDETQSSHSVLPILARQTGPRTAELGNCPSSFEELGGRQQKKRNSQTNQGSRRSNNYSVLWMACQWPMSLFWGAVGTEPVYKPVSRRWSRLQTTMHGSTRCGELFSACLIPQLSSRGSRVHFQMGVFVWGSRQRRLRGSPGMPTHPSHLTATILCGRFARPGAIHLSSLNDLLSRLFCSYTTEYLPPGQPNCQLCLNVRSPPR